MGIVNYEIINTEVEQSRKHRWGTTVNLGVGPRLVCATGKEQMQWRRQKGVRCNEYSAVHCTLDELG